MNPILFECAAYPNLTIPLDHEQGTAIQFRDGRFITADAAELDALRDPDRQSFIAERGEAPAGGAAGGASVSDDTQPVANRYDAFPFEKREYQKGNEPFAVAHLSANLAAVAADVAVIAEAVKLVPTAQLRVVSAARAVIDGVDVEELALDDAAQLAILRKAHVLVRTADEAGDDFELAAIAAGTPTLRLISGDNAAAVLAESLAAIESKYGKAANDAAKASKQLVAAAR